MSASTIPRCTARHLHWNKESCCTNRNHIKSVLTEYSDCSSSISAVQQYSSVVDQSLQLPNPGMCRQGDRPKYFMNNSNLRYIQIITQTSQQRRLLHKLVLPSCAALGSCMLHGTGLPGRRILVPWHHLPVPWDLRAVPL